MKLINDSGSESDEELREAVALAGPGTFVQKEQRVHVCNNTGLLARLAEFSTVEQLPWVERLDVVCDPAPAAVPGSELDFDPATVDVRDDFKRELLFYRMAQAAAADGLSRLKALGVATRRPDDYLAEMVKTDDHMARVRSSLVARQQDLQAREKAKELRQQRKFAKQAQVEATQRKQAERRQFSDALKKIKKTGVDSADLEGILGGKKRGKQQQRQQQGLEDAPMQQQQGKQRKLNKKRDYKNKKFGFGGQKKRSKYNTKESARTFAGFNTAKHGASTAKKAAKFKQPQQQKTSFGKNKNKTRNRKR